MPGGPATPLRPEEAGVSALPTDADLAPYGWAPGQYTALWPRVRAGDLPCRAGRGKGRQDVQAVRRAGLAAG